MKILTNNPFERITIIHTSEDMPPDESILEIDVSQGVVLCRYLMPGSWIETNSTVSEMRAKFMKELSAAAQIPAEDTEKQLNAALETVINKDPFGGIYNGKTLDEACKDEEWRRRARKDMKNDYLKTRVILISKEVYHED